MVVSVLDPSVIRGTGSRWLQWEHPWRKGKEEREKKNEETRKVVKRFWVLEKVN